MHGHKNRGPSVVQALLQYTTCVGFEATAGGTLRWRARHCYIRAENILLMNDITFTCRDAFENNLPSPRPQTKVKLFHPKG
jgi:hypothetical protein